MKGVLVEIRQHTAEVLKYRLNLLEENYFFPCSLTHLFTEGRKYSVDILNELGKNILQ